MREDLLDSMILCLKYLKYISIAWNMLDFIKICFCLLRLDSERSFINLIGGLIMDIV